MRKSGLFKITMVWAFLVVMSVHFLDFPGSVPRFKKESRGGVLLDVSPSFQVETIYQRLTEYGTAGRNSYAFRNLTIDILLPLSMLPFLYLFMGKAVERLRLGPSMKLLLLSFSIAYVLFDLAENAVVVVLLDHFPQRLDFWASLLPFLTLVKRVASVLALFVPLAIFAISSGVRKSPLAKHVV
ncbi:MAG TPA: hypothetical protein VM056_00385 [Terriglobales bacterium]|nr:hypothetical protein [Terriglobales bacterium]